MKISKLSDTRLLLEKSGVKLTIDNLSKEHSAEVWINLWQSNPGGGGFGVETNNALDLFYAVRRIAEMDEEGQIVEEAE